MELHEKEVRFDQYCKKCEHKNLKETLDPCNECLEHEMNYDSKKPIHFKEKA